MSITIYTSSNCSSCKMLKRYLSLKKVEYSELNIDDNEQIRADAIAASGVMSVPVTILERNGMKDVVIGYNLSRLASLLT